MEFFPDFAPSNYQQACRGFRRVAPANRRPCFVFLLSRLMPQTLLGQLRLRWLEMRRYSRGTMTHKLPSIQPPTLTIHSRVTRQGEACPGSSIPREHTPTLDLNSDLSRKLHSLQSKRFCFQAIGRELYEMYSSYDIRIVNNKPHGTLGSSSLSVDVAVSRG